MSKITAFNRGSEWRKWDLHIHTPASALANEFSRNWAAYIAALESLTDVAVLGITDYFSIEGYREVLTYRSRLQNISTILPNIELRLNTLVGKDERRLNYHVVFSDEVTPEVIEEHFLGELDFDSGFDPKFGASKTNLRRKNLEALGTRLKEEQPTFTGSAFEVACKNATVSPERVIEVLNEQRGHFGGRYLLVLAEEGTSEMPWDGQNHLLRKNLILGCHAVFTANSSNINWLLGRKPGGDGFLKEFKKFRPAYHGSDAHTLEKLCKPDKDRNCWIKADPTFEGLKQTLFEPADRVFVGPEKPRQKPRYQVIDSIVVEGSPSWFNTEPVLLNHDLISIIGGRGSGKSALAELIAFAGGSVVFSNGDIRDYFLRKAAERSNSNPQPFIDAKITLRWADGKVDVAELTASNLARRREQEKVKYLPQKFVERLCAPEHTSDLQLEIESVVFQNLSQAERSQASNFAELRDGMTQAISIRRKTADESIREAMRAIAQFEARLASRPVLQKALEQREEELRALVAQPPTVPDEVREELNELQELSLQSQRLQVRIGVFEHDKNQLSAIEARATLIANQIATYNSEMLELAKSAGLESDLAAILAVPPSGYREIILSKRAELEERILAIRKASSESPAVLTLDSIERRRAEITKKLEFAEAKRQEYERFLAQRQELEIVQANLRRDLQLIDQEVEPGIIQNSEVFVENYASIIDLLAEERKLLEFLYAPLSAALADADHTAQKLSFVSRIIFDAQAAATRLYGMLDGRSSLHSLEELEAKLRHFGHDLEEAIEKQPKTQSIQFVRQDIKNIVDDLRVDLTSSDGKTKIIEKQLRNGASKEEFETELFSSKWFSASYALLFDGKPLNLLSPGERGVVLLLLYLEAERADVRPLVIDQPEDNLDNMSVYPDLVDYFRKRKACRQIIIVTHNPNLVVNTDSEQVIFPDFDGARSPRIQYGSGSLENPETRHKVCKVLEGGSDAFRRREEKYALAE